MSSHSNEKEKGLVVFLDALGTKGSWLRAKPEDSISAMIRILDVLEDGRAHIERTMKKGPQKRKFMITLDAFSDTLIVTISGVDVATMIEKAVLLISGAITAGIDNGIFFRGAMGYGIFFRGKKSKYPFILGPVVDEVAEWFEAGNWIGVHSTPSLTFLIEKISAKHPERFVPRLLVRYEIPTNLQIQYNAWAVNWPFDSYVVRKIILGHDLPMYEAKPLSLKQVSDYTEANKEWILEKFSSIPIGIRDSSKFSNTLKFVDYIVEDYKTVNNESHR